MPVTDASAPSIADRPLQIGLSRRFARFSERLEALFDRERDQLPLWLPVGFGLGIAAWFVLPDSHSWTAFLLAAAAAVAGLLALAGGTRWGRALAIFSLAAAIGCGHVWLRAERVGEPSLKRARMAEFEARIASFQRLPAKEAVRLVVEPVGAPDLPSKLRINVAQDRADPRLQPGARVRLKAWLMPPAPMAVSGGYDFARAAWFQGIGGTGRALGEVQILSSEGEHGWRARVSMWRQRLADHVGGKLQGGEGGIAVALATGDQGAIPEEVAEAMSAPDSPTSSRSAGFTLPLQ